MAVTTSGARRRAPRLPAAVRREQILDAALRLVIDHGFAAISMEGVARAVGVAKTVVYEAFANTDELLRALLHREDRLIIAEVAELVPAEPGDADPERILVDGMIGMLRAVRRRPDSWRLFLLPPDGTPPALRRGVARRRQELLRQLRPLVEWAAVRRPALARLDPELAARLILGLGEEAARLTLERPRQFTPERVAEFLGSLLSLASASASASGMVE
jgi:AcrR family transcriptional regulator